MPDVRRSQGVCGDPADCGHPAAPGELLGEETPGGDLGPRRAPVGALASVSGDELTLLAAGVNSDGSDKLVERAGCARDGATELAARMGRLLLAQVALR